MNNYLIPANSKKSQLILGFFNAVDLILFGSGVGITLILLLTIQSTDVVVMMLILAPALITGFLVMPVPNYHNVMTFIGNILNYYSAKNPREYIWKGWCVKDVYGKDREE